MEERGGHVSTSKCLIFVSYQLTRSNEDAIFSRGHGYAVPPTGLISSRILGECV